MNKLKQR